MQNKILIYSDGACSGNPGPGGWGACIISNSQVLELYGSEKYTTNNRMEIRGAIEGLKNLTSPSNIELYTDSIYLKDGISKWVNTWLKNGWMTSANKPVKNVDLWQELINLINFHNVSWHWVKGHNGDKYNTLADRLAVKGKREAEQISKFDSQ